ncbi:QRFP-like peptide receptor [Octopus bimaculoides]|uniref:G-protein coupled receptors family 1 profile domain-containing protein n=1 Tax=Octopus bimaculoides TaxID=37653 RepID=A0A0L8FNE5_OCTBM|nr:QRFP-like peptide receptor [Octopus bimaculoides]|eukprot:XP_014788310.1 PREDICTED: orexin receptor type 2-like [Octopus bimaculoides]
MDQFSEFIAYKKLLQRKNFSLWMQSAAYNFTGAHNILQEFTETFYLFNNFQDFVLVMLYIPIFATALSGNILIIMSVLKDVSWCKARNFFLFNLSVADLCVTLICMPMAVGMLIYRLWIYGEFLCKVTAFMQGVAITNSIFTLMVMSVDRYLSLQYAHSTQRTTSPQQAIVIIITIWVLAALIMGPLLFIREIDVLVLPTLEPMTFCIENWPQNTDREAYAIFLFFVVYIIPSTTLFLCYIRVFKYVCKQEMQRENSDCSTKRLISRRKAARMLIILVLIFMVCWLPYNIVSLISDIWGSAWNQLDLLRYALWLGHSHSAINPVMYWLLNKRFRQQVRRMFRKTKNCGSSHTCHGFISLPTPKYV